MQNPQLWADMRSRMSRETHVRICEDLGVGFPRVTRPLTFQIWFLAISGRSHIQNSDEPKKTRLNHVVFP